jgi:glycosyltransferase involved in cell wall biosynthesis
MNQKFNGLDYLQREIKKRKKIIKSLNHEISYLSTSIKKIENSRAFKLWLIIGDIKSFLKKILLMFSLNKIKNVIKLQQQNIHEKKYITRLNNVEVSKNYKISVVIPTYYAEDFMPALLKAISAQKHIDDLDLIIIDSESKDKTQQLAKDFGANLLTIKQKDFTHSLARNIAAKEAKHDLILFTVQDELPADNTTFAKMAELLSLDENIATVSTNQMARPDADLFARWQVDNHNEALDLTYDSTSRVDNFNEFSKESFVLQRRVSLLDDVCAMYRKNIFNELEGFTEVIFGEDLDYAFKALKSGFKLGLLCSSGVIHSHNRPAHYFLKRTFISSMLDLDLLSAVDTGSSIDPTLDLIAGLTISEYLSSNENLSNFSKNDLNDFIDEFVIKDLKKDEVSTELSKLLFSTLESTKLNKKHISNEDVLNYYQVLLNILNSYLDQRPHIIATNRDKLIFLERMLATKVGDTLARYCLGKQTTKVKQNTKVLKDILYGNV